MEFFIKAPLVQYAPGFISFLAEAKEKQIFQIQIHQQGFFCKSISLTGQKDKHYFQVPASMLSVTIGTLVESGGGDGGCIQLEIHCTVEDVFFLPKLCFIEPFFSIFF